MIQIVNKKYNDMLYDTRPVKLSEFLSNKYNIIHRKMYNQAVENYIKDWIYVKNLIKDTQTLENSRYDYNYKEVQQLQRKINHNKSYINKHIGDKRYIDEDKEKFYNVSTIEEFKEYSFLYEIPNNEYWQPSKCVIMTKYKDTRSPNLKWIVDLTPYWNFYQQKKDKDIEKLKMDINENIGDSEIINFNYVTGKATLYSENLDKTYEVDFDYLDGNKNKISEEMLLSKTFTANL